MPPEDRFVPRFAAEPPQDLLPYGRWAQTLTEEFLAACLRIDSEGEELGEPGDVNWYPDRTWHGRTFVPGTALTSEGYELFGYVSFAPGGDGAEPDEFHAVADYTAETAEANPDWQIDLCDEVVGTWRRAQADLSVQAWRKLTRAERDAVEAEAHALPLPGIERQIAVRWDDEFGRASVTPSD